MLARKKYDLKQKTAAGTAAGRLLKRVWKAATETLPEHVLLSCPEGWEAAAPAVS
ncbi:MAG: hypothetical protein ACOX0Y_03560 [Thiopseudomonas sp.]